jgi:hypothetical protein
MDGSGRGRRLRSFALGGLVGAAGAIATARRATSRSRRPRGVPSGLAAFEDAPCFVEAVINEARRANPPVGSLATGTKLREDADDDDDRGDGDDLGRDRAREER